MTVLRLLLSSLLFASCGTQNQTTNLSVTPGIPEQNEHTMTLRVENPLNSTFDLTLNSVSNTVSYKATISGEHQELSMPAKEWFRCINSYKTPDSSQISGSESKANAQAKDMAKAQRFAIDSIYSFFDQKNSQQFIDKYSNNPYGLTFGDLEGSTALVDATSNQASVIAYFWQAPFSSDAKTICAGREIDFSSTVYIP